MTKFIEKIRAVWTDKGLRGRMLFVFGILIVTRLLASIPIPNIDQNQLAAFLRNNQFIGLLNVFSGGGLSTLSIAMLAVGPFITATIIMQLLTMMSSKLKEMSQNEGEAGRRKINQYSRLLTIPLALVQAFGFLILLQRQGIVPSLMVFKLITDVVVIMSGSVLMMWLGELITEFGVGNGVSLIIFAGIVARLPLSISQALFSFDVGQLPMYLAFLVAVVFIIYAVVLVNEAERPVQVTYAKRVRGNKVYGGVSTYLPLRLNQAGVIPIIFALSILLIPQFLFNILATMKNAMISGISHSILNFLSNQLFYGICYFVLVFLFTYFYTAVTFDPEMISTNLQKNGAFIPGVRPGAPTSAHLTKILLRITFVGALFLGLIAVLPLILKAITGITSLAIGGTALLIVVSVVLDLVKKIDAQLSAREY
ncbi:MAG: preprotein translocase subunit SecY [bacterium]